LLSIDIDGNDYNVWRDLSGYTVDIVVIEYNYTFPPWFEYVDDGGHQNLGSSAQSLVLLGALKGY
jgi:hypothetical protein